jgi:hypothetical protein
MVSRCLAPTAPLSRIIFMSEHQWELYRLSVVETWPDSPYKAVTIAGIRHKLSMIENAGIENAGARMETKRDRWPGSRPGNR